MITFNARVWIPPRNRWEAECLAVLSPLVLTSNLFFLLGREVVGDVKGLTDLLGGFALDHVRNGLATNVEKRLDIKVVGSLDILVSTDLKVDM
jgi:hypothetical protein